MRRHYRRLVIGVSLLAAIIVTLTTGGVISQAAKKKAVPSIDYLGGVYNSCKTLGVVSIPDHVRTDGSGSFTVVATASGVGTIGTFTSNFYYPLDADGVFTLSLSSNYNFNVDTVITVTFVTFHGANESGDVSYVSTGAWDCTTGNAAGPLPGGLQAALGNSTMNGFVLATITCNTPVFSAPGGAPVGNNAVSAGQTWFVNPTAVTDAAHHSWTEIFVSSTYNPFIPTRCVAGH